MQAIVITRPGDSAVLEVREQAKPEPGYRQVLVRVAAAGLNRSDIMQRQGGYGTDPSGQVPGLEMAGTVEQCGPGANRWRAGDAVCALLPGGGYAEYVAVDERHCLPVPDGMSMTDAASLPETVLTVWSNVFQQVRLRAGEHFLVHGGSSGIGITAIQLAAAFGAKAFATVGNDEKKTFCERLGAERVVNYKTEDFEDALKPYGLDVILDMVGGDYTEKNIRLLRTDGRLTFINAMKGPESTINIRELMSKRIVLTGSMLKPRTDEQKSALVADVLANVWPLVSAGRVKPVVYRTFPLAEAAQAQQLMESSDHIGKIILTVGPHQ
ncbi:NAD(P)H-quinone oxidoreductase [Spirosoma rhododendri]|uniref:NAD(P)H-quinone oxidoreductase n=1 Tax=Spirosoma rhododendri TaxID=2728024 RepID=A0A7L5DMR6_9BACT|nr:NAD(P)H-quinone oxidoreductase [Spirosoma rhododendri]QJD77050.1 NAD(P)H-quinone oxidoreductase [Spirosoma rhododendri]